MGYAMRSLVEYPATSLKWLRGDFSPPGFELLGVDGVYATLTFLDAERTLARVSTAEGEWTLKHLGVLNPVVTLRMEGNKTNMATFHPHAFRHGKLDFLDGATFDWKWFHEAEAGGGFLDPAGRPMISLFAHSGRDLGPTVELRQCEVDLDPALSTQLRGAMLAAFGWFLILFDEMREKDAVAAETSLRL
jgi:hypothetical protein